MSLPLLISHLFSPVCFHILIAIRNFMLACVIDFKKIVPTSRHSYQFIRRWRNFVTRCKLFLSSILVFKIFKFNIKFESRSNLQCFEISPESYFEFRTRVFYVKVSYTLNCTLISDFDNCTTLNFLAIVELKWDCRCVRELLFVLTEKRTRRACYSSHSPFTNLRDLNYFYWLHYNLFSKF